MSATASLVQGVTSQSASASMALQGAATLSKFSTQRQQANVAKAQGDYSASVATQNAGLAEGQATDALDRGAQQESRFRAGTRQLIGSERAAASASGIDAGSGSAADTQANSAFLGELDAMSIRSNAAREAYGYQVQAMNYRTEAGMDKAAGENEAAALRAESLGTLLTGGAQMFAYNNQNPIRWGRAGSSTSVPGGGNAANSGAAQNPPADTKAGGSKSGNSAGSGSAAGSGGSGNSSTNTTRTKDGKKSTDTNRVSA